MADRDSFPDGCFSLEEEPRSRAEKSQHVLITSSPSEECVGREVLTHHKTLPRKHESELVGRDEMRGEGNVQQLSEKSSSWLEKESLDTLVNVSSRLAVHSTATASVCRGVQNQP